MNAAAIAAAEETGDARSAIAARLASSLIGLLVRAEGGVDEVADEINRALPTFEAAGDDATVARLLTRLADGYWWRCQVGPMEEALERALVHAHRADDPSRVSNVSIRLGFATVVGPLAIDLGRPRLDELIEGAAPDSAAKGVLLVASSLLAAMAGAFDEARSRCGEGKEILDALGQGVSAAAITTWSSAIELLAGDAGAAERELRPALERLQEIGERGNLASIAAQLAEALHAQGRSEEALAVDASRARRRPLPTTSTPRSRGASRVRRRSPSSVAAARRRRSAAPPWSSPARPIRRCSPPRLCSRSRRRTRPPARPRRAGTPRTRRSSSTRRRGTWSQRVGRGRSARNWRHVQR